ncbi:MAG: biopolymer transporter ExbD [Bacteroidia bacterium]|nr:biopolymer transporter ExbD [Bacteroidia bacterium]HQV00665.1 biopolymer transporter ExbD [Bacteroidia bacterium]
MPKVKVKRKPPHIDMTAMTDVAFLLLTFFMLTTKFKPDEPFVVDPPSSVSDYKLPESNVIQISVDATGKVFFSTGQGDRRTTLEKMAKQYNLTFTEQELRSFSLLETFGVPVSQLKQYLALKPNERAKVNQPGIPTDSTDNQLRDWILFARQSNPQAIIAIKGDGDAEYPVMKNIIATLQERKVNRFNFITNLENAPQ